MKNAPRIIILTTGLMLLTLKILAAEDITINVHLFRGAWAEGHPGLEGVTVLTAASHPAIEALKAKLDAPQNELTAAAIDALIESQDLKTVDDYFVYAQKWTGRAGVFSHDIEHKLYRFKFVYIPRYLSPQRIELGIALYKSKGVRTEKVLDAKLFLDLDNPVMVGMPSGEESFFMLLYVRRAGKLSTTQGAGAKQAAPIEAPKAVYTLMPAYPEELRRHGVRGRVELQVAIDDKGTVTEAKVEKSIHPYLDFSAVQAIRQWKYEPAIQNGKPIPVIHSVTLFFDPETYRHFEEKAKERAETVTGEEPSSGSTLAKILEGAAEYCRKLTGAALDFICEEKTNEIHYNFGTEPKWAGLVVSSKETGRIVKESWFPQWDPMRTEKNKYVCDYLFVRKGERFEERRIIIQDNGRKMLDRSRLLEEKRFTALNPVLAAVELLDRDRQPLYNFRIVGTEHVQGRKALVIEAIPKSGNTLGVEYAKIWLDQTNHQVLKSEIQGVPLEGYDDVLRDAVQFRVRPYLLTTHAYDFEKNGVRFPSRSTIRVEYPRRGDFYKDRTLKLKIDMVYENYKFFTVETESGIKE